MQGTCAKVKLCFSSNQKLATLTCIGLCCSAPPTTTATTTTATTTTTTNISDCRTLLRPIDVIDAGTLLATPHTHATALGTAAEDETQDQQDPCGDHQDDGGGGAVAVRILADQHQDTVAREIGMGGVAGVAIKIQQAGLHGRAVKAVDIGQSRIAAAHRMHIRLHFGETHHRVIGHDCTTQPLSH